MASRNYPKALPGETPAQMRDRLKAELEALENKHPNPAKNDSRAVEKTPEPSGPALSEYRQGLIWNDERDRWEDDPARYR